MTSFKHSMVESSYLAIGVVSNILNALDNTTQCASCVEILLGIILYYGLKRFHTAVKVADSGRQVCLAVTLLIAPP
jgi:hypothetical protein